MILRAQSWRWTLMASAVGIIVLIFHASSLERTRCEQAALPVVYEIKKTWPDVGWLQNALAPVENACPLPTSAQKTDRPLLAQLYTQRANWWWEQKEWARAVADYKNALAWMPEQVVLHQRIAEATLFYLQKPEDARQEIERALAIEPANFYNHLLMSQIQLTLGENQIALEQIQTALKITKTGYAFAVEGDVLTKMERWDEAATSYQQALDFGEKSAWVYYKLGIALQRVGRADEARRALETAHALDNALPAAP